MGVVNECLIELKKSIFAGANHFAEDISSTPLVDGHGHFATHAIP